MTRAEFYLRLAGTPKSNFVPPRILPAPSALDGLLGMDHVRHHPGFGSHLSMGATATEIAQWIKRAETDRAA